MTINNKTKTKEPNDIVEVKEIVVERDRFATDASFIDPNARLPRIQALRGMDSNMCGYFISLNEITKAGWLGEIKEEQVVNYTYESSGNVEQGLLFNKPRMLVCPRTPILGFDRAKTKETQQLVIVGAWNKPVHSLDDNIGNAQIYEVLLLDNQNQPLHSIPFSYIAKGANQASFAIAWQELVQTITTYHALANRIPARPKDLRFQSLCVFAFEVKKELAGTKTKSPACKVVSYEKPNRENWKSYFLGDVAEQMWELLAPTQPLFLPQAVEPLAEEALAEAE